MLTAQGGTAFPAQAVGWLGFGQPLEVRRRESLAGHLADVAAVEPIFEPPAPWKAIRARWHAYLELSTPSVHRLAEHLTAGGGDPAGLRAHALAELAARGENEADLSHMLADRVTLELSALWRPHAVKAFRAVGKAFDAAVSRDDIAQLDPIADALAAAARLCGADNNCAPWAVERLTLGLTVDPGKAHIRRVAQAFCGPDRWTAVQALGGKLKATADPLTTYPPLPAFVAIVGEDRIVRNHDPLDEWPPGARAVPDGWC
jgi:hypothetical protein